MKKKTVKVKNVEFSCTVTSSPKRGEKWRARFHWDTCQYRRERQLVYQPILGILTVTVVERSYDSFTLRFNNREEVTVPREAVDDGYVRFLSRIPSGTGRQP